MARRAYADASGPLQPSVNSLETKFTTICRSRAKSKGT